MKVLFLTDFNLKYKLIPCYKSIKTLADKIIALVLIVLLSPIMVLICGILFVSGNGVFFTQRRIGFFEESFIVYKFKTMTDEEGPEQDRITFLGKFLRAYSLDEIPQLWNIIKGDMSFIGPRPLLEDYLPVYSDGHKRRHWVMPGITGLAQVSGRNNISWEEKFDLDLSYQENVSFWLDMKILLATVLYFLNGSPGNHPVEKFTGYKQHIS